MKKTSLKIIIITLVSIAILGTSLIFVSKFLDQLNTDFIIEGQEQLNGTFKTFYENGTVKSLETFENGKRNGLNIYYFPSTCIKSVKNFKQGNLNGSSCFFSEEGDTVFIEYYENNMIKTKEILNDSLYQFELNYLDHGMMIFNNQCRMCHNFNEDSLIQKSIITINNLDSNLIYSDYITLFHQNTEAQDSLNQLSDSIRVFLNQEKTQSNYGDIHLLKKVFENEINRPKLKYKRVKKLNKKAKVS